MRFLFALLYAIVGALLLYSDFSSGAAAPMQARLVWGGAGLVCLFAAWQGWFGGRLAWRIVHTIFGVGVVGACVLLWIVGIASLPQKSAFIPPIVVLMVAGVLTVPACGYLISLIGWWRAGRGAASGSDDDPAESAPGADTVPGGVALAAAGATAPAASASPAGRTLRRPTGIGIAVVLVVAVAGWARFGAEWRCSASDTLACIRAGEAAVARGDPAKAVALYERAIPAELAIQVSAPDRVPFVWSARNDLLVRMHDRSGLTKAIGEACPRLEKSCEDLVKTLTKANEPAFAEAAWRTLCRTGSEDACGRYGMWLVETKGAAPALEAMRGYCATGSKEACFQLGIELKKHGEAEEAHAVLMRSCTLSLAEQRAGISPKTALCQAAIRQERSVVTREQWLDDIRSVCADRLRECFGAVMDVDGPTQKQLLEEACRIHAGDVACLNRYPK